MNPIVCHFLFSFSKIFLWSDLGSSEKDSRTWNILLKKLFLFGLDALPLDDVALWIVGYNNVNEIITGRHCF